MPDSNGNPYLSEVFGRGVRLDSDGFSIAVGGSWTTLVDATTIAVSTASASKFAVTLTASGHTIGNPTGGEDGDMLSIRVNVGAGPYTHSWGDKYRFPFGPPHPSRVASDVDVYRFEYNEADDTWDSFVPASKVQTARHELTSLSICDYGASDGNECTAEIQAAFDAAGDEGRECTIPPGQYATTTNLHVKYNGTRISGSSRGIAKLVTDGDEPWPQPTGGQVWYPGLIGIIHPDILSGAVSQTLARTDPAYRVHDVTISDLHFTGPWAFAITTNGSQNVVVTRCKFTGFRREIIWPANHPNAVVSWLLSHNYLESDNDEVALTNGAAVIACNFIDSLVSDNIIIGGYQGIGLSGVRVTCTSNTIIRPIKSGIGVSDSAGTSPQGIVSNNTIYLENGSVANVADTNGIIVGESARGTSIVGNAIWLKHVGDGGAISGIHSVARTGEHVISGNVINLDQNSIAQAAIGIRIGSGTNAADETYMTVSNNTITLQNEKTSASRYGITSSIIGNASTLDVKLLGNHVSGISGTGEGYAYRFSASVGALKGKGRDNTYTGGRFRISSTIELGSSVTYYRDKLWEFDTDRGVLTGRNNMAATDAPTANDDITEGYIAGASKWWDETNDKLYECIDHTDGAARWWNATDGGIVP